MIFIIDMVCRDMMWHFSLICLTRHIIFIADTADVKKALEELFIGLSIKPIRPLLGIIYITRQKCILNARHYRHSLFYYTPLPPILKASAITHTVSPIASPFPLLSPFLIKSYRLIFSALILFKASLIFTTYTPLRAIFASQKFYALYQIYALFLPLYARVTSCDA